MDFYKKLKTTFINSIPESGNIIIFGAGNYGKTAHLILESNNIFIKAFCDNSSKLWGEKITYIPVISPAEAFDKYPDAVYIIANKACKSEIREQLCNAGIKDENIIEYGVGKVNMEYIKKF